MKTLDIAKFAHRMGFKYRELAEELGTSTSLIGQVARGKSKFSYENVVKLIELGITAEELLGEELGKEFKKRCYEEYVKENRDSVTPVDVSDAKSMVVVGLQKILDEVKGQG
ncbi:MAG: helix-turn-helix domain-containing protein [Fibromonadaceae bacterium]|jgi:transcriptional regulator with XRE-family HTH domain|nr:helix-turn-helix domain-containing protein [Fibromonadaceae bacterium]